MSIVTNTATTTTLGNGCGSTTLRLNENIKQVEFKRDPISISVLGEINDELAHEFVEQLTLAQNTGQSIVPILIHSIGGCVYSLFYMINAIRACKIKVATIVGGIAASAAACLFTCGHPDYRFMGPDARLMIHSVSSTIVGSIDAAGIKAEAEEIKKGE